MYTHKPSIALVNPPFAPVAMPNLGIAVLSASLKANGYDCQTFYPDLDLIKRLPGRKLSSRLGLYHKMSLMPFHPWNEWIFSAAAFPDWQGPDPSSGLKALDRRHRGRLHRRALKWIKRYPPPSVVMKQLRNSAPEIVDFICQKLEPFDVIGFSNTFHQTVATLAVARRLKQRWPEKVILMGGANCEGNAGQFLLDEFPYLDAVFVGDAENSLPSYLQALQGEREMNGISGVYYRDHNGKATISAPMDSMDSFLNSLAPDFDDYIRAREEHKLDEQFPLVLPMESSRGCWWGAKSHCTFCGLNSSGMKFRQKDFAQFESEFSTVVDQYHPRFIFMTDNIMALDYFEHLSKGENSRTKGVDIFFETKANLNRRQVAAFAQAGVTHIQPGIESFSSPMLKLMRKGLTGIQVVALLKYCRDYGILCNYYILGGFPGEDPAEFSWMHNIAPQLEHLKPPEGVFAISFVRSSPYHQDPESFGIKLKRSWFYDFLFPFSEEAKNELAYYYDADAPAEPKYIAPLRDRLFRWRRKWDANRCVFTWRMDGSDVVIQDRRPNLPAHDYRLKSFAAAVFLALDAPIGIRNLLPLAEQIAEYGIPDGQPDGKTGLMPWVDHHAPIGERFSPLPETELTLDADVSKAGVLQFLEELEGLSLIFREGVKWISLPAVENYAPYEIEWIKKGYYFG